MKKIGFVLLICGCLLFCLIMRFFKNFKIIPLMCLFTIFTGSLLIIIERIVNKDRYAELSVSDARIMIGAIGGLIFSLMFFFQLLFNFK